MSELSADVLEWLKAKYSKPHVFTRAELTALDLYTQGASMASIGRMIGKSPKRVMDYLVMLNMYAPRNKTAGTREIPWTSDLRCPRCGILLSYADAVVDGYCDWCAEDLEKTRDTGADTTDWAVVLEYTMDTQRGG